MTEPLTIKTIGSLIGGAISAFLMAAFNLSFPSFASGFVGALIGEMMRKKSTFKEALLVTSAISILTAWAGAYLINKYPDIPATSILGITGWFFSFHREFVSELVKDGFAVIFKRKTGQ